MKMNTFLKKAQKNGIIRPIDFYFSQFISTLNPFIMLAAACISYESQKGYIFLGIEYFEKNMFFSHKNKLFIQKIINILKKKPNWLKEFLHHPSFSNGSIVTPLVLHDKKIYIYKMWKAKKKIIEMLRQRNYLKKINIKKSQNILNQLFPIKSKNIQKIAVALTLIRNIVFIIGSPGTGKTTTIINIIIAIIKNTKDAIKIQLAAPTGKATMRLNDILKNNIFDIQLNSSEKNHVPISAITIHKLLRIEKISQKMFFNENNKLTIDVLIIDESSMIDLIMMENIFCAISKHTKVIFIGDYNQLCPIEAGSILRDICYYANDGYSKEMTSLLQEMTKYAFSQEINQKKTTFISDSICVLKENHRFKKESGIHILANAILHNKTAIIQKTLNNSTLDVSCFDNSTNQAYQTMINNIIIQYKKYWIAIYQKNNLKKIINILQKNQVLCLLRKGSFGVNGVNQAIESVMYKKNIIRYISNQDQKWYIGKPIIMTHNNKYLGLFNGEIGVLNVNNKGIFQVSFLKDNEVENFPINILKEYDTAWAITVHKAQGSEFNHTILIIPNIEYLNFKKDILYTATTRSKYTLSIYTKKEIFINLAARNLEKNIGFFD